jgi:hypothetical protein
VIDSCKVGMLADSLDTGSYDPEGAPVTLALVPAPPYDIGVHPVDFIVTDDCGATDTTQITITVFNNIPVAMAVTQLVLEGDSLTCGAAADPSEFDDGSSDADGHSLFFSAEPPSPYPYGSTQVMFIVSNGRRCSIVRKRRSEQRRPSASRNVHCAPSRSQTRRATVTGTCRDTPRVARSFRGRPAPIRRVVSR